MRDARSIPFLLAAMLVLVLAVVVHGGVLTRGDFGRESWPAYAALMDGDLAGFWEKAPGYTAFVVAFGAPSALVADIFGWGPEAVYRLVSLPGVIVLGFLAVALASSGRGLGRATQWMGALLATGGALTWLAMHYGHAEDVLAAGASVLAVMAALRGRSGWTVCLLILAVAAKQWAVLAVLPAAAAAPRGGLRIALAAGVGAAAIVVLQSVANPVAASALTSTDSLFHTRQIWYPLGIDVPSGTPGVLSGERIAPDWLGSITRPLTVILGAALALGWWARRAAGRVEAVDVLALLAAVFLMRCLLDPWNISYYHLPFMLSLVAWEVVAARRTPWLSAGVSAILLVEAVTWQMFNGAAAYLLYIGWVLPLGAYLVARAFRVPRRVVAAAPAGSTYAAAWASARNNVA